jgi:pyrroloquinoline quinone biosynthesis protein D
MKRVHIDEASVPRLPPGVKLKFDRQRDQWVVLAPERLFVPDEIALAIVRKCDGAASVGSIVDALAGEYQAPRDQVGRDVVALLQELTEKGVMTA